MKKASHSHAWLHILALAFLGLNTFAQEDREFNQESSSSLTYFFSLEDPYDVGEPIQDETSFVEPIMAKGNFGLFFCGDGLHSPGELCFEDPVLVANMPGENPSIDTGYMNGGSNLDFVFSKSVPDQVTYLLGSGNGTFWGTFTKGAGDGPSNVKLADFNGDGRLDIIATNFYTDRVRILWGHNNWNSWSWYHAGDGPYRLAVGDINLDGLDDFAVANALSDNITVRLRLPGGGFSSQTIYSGDDNTAIALADVNNDRWPDLIYSNDTFMKVRLNNQNGGFNAAITVNMAAAGSDNFYSVAVADFNHDGDADMVAARNDHTLVRVLGNGNGTFQAAATAATYSNPWTVRAFDFDKDGDLDFVVSHFLDNRITIYRGMGNGNFYTPKVLDAPGVIDVNAGDFNNDGSLDVVFSGYNGASLMLANP